MKIKGWKKAGKLSWRNINDGLLFLNIRKDVYYPQYDVVLKKQGVIYEVKIEFSTLQDAKDYSYKWMRQHPNFKWYPHGISGDR